MTANSHISAGDDNNVAARGRRSSSGAGLGSGSAVVHVTRTRDGSGREKVNTHVKREGILL